jgi:hypothetical protein
MDLGTAAEGIGMAHRAGWLLCILGVHFAALVLCWFDPVRPRERHLSVLPYFALAMVLGCHVALIIKGLWRPVILDGSPVWTAILAAAGGWVVICAWRATSMRHSRTLQ